MIAIAFMLFARMLRVWWVTAIPWPSAGLMIQIKRRLSKERLHRGSWRCDNSLFCRLSPRVRVK